MNTDFDPCTDFYNYTCGTFDTTAAAGGKYTILVFWCHVACQTVQLTRKIVWLQLYNFSVLLIQPVQKTELPTRLQEAQSCDLHVFRILLFHMIWHGF